MPDVEETNANGAAMGAESKRTPYPSQPLTKHIRSSQYEYHKGYKNYLGRYEWHFGPKFTRHVWKLESVGRLLSNLTQEGSICYFRSFLRTLTDRPLQISAVGNGDAAVLWMRPTRRTIHTILYFTLLGGPFITKGS